MTHETQSAPEHELHPGAEDRLAEYLEFLDNDIIDGYSSELLVTLHTTDEQVCREGNALIFNIGVRAFEDDEVMDSFRYPCTIDLHTLSSTLGEPENMESEEGPYPKGKDSLGNHKTIRNYIKRELLDFCESMKKESSTANERPTINPETVENYLVNPDNAKK